MIANATAHTPAPEITAELDRGIINLDGGSVRHLVITIKAPLLPKSDTPQLPLNLGLVIDASGSMSGRPFEAVKMATVALLEKLATTDHLSLVSFASDVMLHAEAVRLDGVGRAVIGEAVRPLVTRDSTDLFGGWVAGCEAVAKRQAAADALERNHVILLSDGHANQGETDPHRLAHHAGELRKRGVLTSTVGVGTGYSPVQLQAVSEAGGGRMHDAELPEEIAEIMFAELTDALATTIENLEVTLRLPPGVEAELYGTAAVNRDAEGCEILAGSMIAGGVRRMVVKLTFPAGKADDNLAVAVTARWKTPGEEAGRSHDVGLVEARFATPEACLSQPRSRELAVIVAEQWQAHIYHRAMILNQDGQYQAAHAFAERESRFFDRYCHDLPELRSSVEELSEFTPTTYHAFREITSKEVAFRTYKSSRGEADRRSRTRQSLKEIIRSEAARRGKS